MKRKLPRSVAVLTAAALLLGLPAAGVRAAEEEPTPDYQPTADSLDTHPVPEWFDDAKFGIFIHWGAYSVPAWGPRGSYAEWYWAYLNQRNSPTYQHHRDTYGTDYDYDRFIDAWRAEKFDPAGWVDLFNDAGAKYFVLTSKHHEGVALWDTATGTRDAVDRGPRRDLAGELVAAARRDGKLKAGFYYSLYEWNNPNYTGRQPTNPYTGASVPYTGIGPVADYVHDYMHPQVRELIDRYDPDILWCDGQWERSAAYWDMAPVIADYYNQAKNRQYPKDVVVANRCKTRTGALDSPELDFQTPEYTVKADIDPVKWEASRGIAHSYGYNANEPEEDYLTSNELIDSLADIVSKNGNLLLDIGPRADGTIPELMQQRLRDIGAWLRVNGEAIYGTTYFSHAEDRASNVPIRYTVKDGSLYAIALAWPGERLTLGGDLPFGQSTTVRLLGADGSALPWQRDAQGNVVITTPGEAATTSQHAYVFKISTPGVHQLIRSTLDAPGEVAPGGTVQGTVKLTSTGSTTSPDVRVSLAAPAGWTIEPTRTVVPEIPAGQTVEVPVTLSVPAGAATGSYPISLTTEVGRIGTRTTRTVEVVLPNVALGKPATQQSLAWGGVPSRAVDGNTDGAYGAGSVTHTAEPSNQAWWQVDLEASYAIDQIAVWNRTDCCANRLSNYWVLVSESPITADSLEAARTAPGVTALHQPGQAGRPTRIDLAGLRGRYVRIQLESASNPLSLAEVQVRAKPDGGA
ncbi:alpha-L-fucosidase [Micromonospora yasonensis]|uniref:alpha-L-fucosidase n=1 Tax=Micromonospora yasonensis TaxID=1128667 RepID=UPI00222F7AE7|nr:alpha-L-fucosidase [Micromonospora yasonensis]MCW3839565.1 alpha-L-fucosidase [Micromonospora yasonensis]